MYIFADGTRLPFLLSGFVKGKLSSYDLGSDDFNLPILDDSFDGSGSEVSNSQNLKEDEEESESSLRVHDSYDDDTGEQTPNVTTVPVTVSGSDDEGEGEE